MSYKKSPRLYQYAFEPNFGDLSRKEYEYTQFTGIESTLRSHSDAILELQTGTATGATITLAPNGVKAGRYRRPIITIGEDGRVVAAEEGPAPADPLPRTTTPGLVLTSTVSGPAWRAPKTELPAGGAPGQVLTRTTDGLEWLTQAVPTAGVTSVALSVGEGLTGSGAAVTGAGTLDVALAESGVEPGSYQNAILEIDEFGRIVEAISQDTPPSIPVGYGENASVGSHRYWRLAMDFMGFSAPTPEVGTVLFCEGPNAPDLGGVETRDAGLVIRDFGSNVSIAAITITASDGASAPKGARLHHSDDGALWSTAWIIPPQGPWTDGETRTFTLGPSISLDGPVYGTGSNVIQTHIANSGVVPGSYTNANITVGADGRVTAAANGTATGGSFDPLQPLDYFTMTDQGTGGIVFLVIENGAWTFTEDGVRGEDGFPIQAEDGTGSIQPES